MTKRLLIILVALATLTLNLSSCKEDEPKKVTIRISVQPNTLSLTKGMTSQLSVSVVPEGTKFSFESANKDIATVDEKGLVTAIAVGKTTILVKAEDATQEVPVNVFAPSDIIASRYLGKDVKGKNNKKLIIPIYMMEFAKLDTGMALLTQANEQYGWRFHDHMKLSHNIESYIFYAPTDDKGKELDGRLIAHITYIYNTENDGGSLSFISKTFSDIDLLEDALKGNEKTQKTLKEIAALYGFDSTPMFGKNEDGEPCLTAYNTNQFPEGSFVMEMKTSRSSDRFGIQMQIKLEEAK